MLQQRAGTWRKPGNINPSSPGNSITFFSHCRIKKLLKTLPDDVYELRPIHQKASKGLQPPTIPGAKADMMVGCGISPSCDWNASVYNTLEGRASTSGQNGTFFEWHCQPLHCLFSKCLKVSFLQGIMNEAQEPQMEKDNSIR